MAPMAYMMQDKEIDSFLPTRSAVGAASKAPQRFPTLSCSVLDTSARRTKVVLLWLQSLQTLLY